MPRSPRAPPSRGARVTFGGGAPGGPLRPIDRRGPLAYALSMNDWIGILPHDDTSRRGWHFHGADLRGPLEGAALDAALEGLASEAILMADAAGAPSETVPANLLPDQLLHSPGGLVLPPMEQASPAARIRAERLLLIGFMALNPNWDGVVCLPGEVTTWASLSAGEVIFLQQSVTGRLAAALGAVEMPDTAALETTLSRPERLATDLRAAELSGQPGAAMGHLLGAELAASRGLWLGQQLAVIGTGTLARAYAAALKAQGAPVTEAAPEAMAQQGFLALAQKFGLPG